MNWKRVLPRGPLLVTLAVLVGMFMVGGIAFDNFASLDVVRNLLVDNTFLAVAAIGATFVILSGGIDLSVGSVMACTSILVGTLIERGHVHPLAAFAIALAAGGLFGALQGLLITAFELPAFLVTLAGLFFARGVAFAINPQSVGISHAFVSGTINESMSLHLPIVQGGISLPITVPVALGTLLLAWGFLRHTRFGRAVYAVGDDASAAALMGLPVARTRLMVYVISGLLSALAGLLFTLYQQSGDPAACKGIELDAIAAVVIGGTLLRGGVGSVFGSIAGVLTLGLIQTIIAFQGNLSSWWARIVAGGLVLVYLGLHRGMARLSAPGGTRQ